MTKQEIIEGSKTIAKYLGWKYIPFTKESKLKPGWYKTETRIDKGVEELEVKSLDLGLNTISTKTITINPLVFKDSAKKKSGWKIVEDKYYKFFCRNHNQLRFYNNFDSLIPAIEKLESEKVLYNRLYDTSTLFLNGEPLGQGKGQGIIKDTFKAVVETINYINSLKDDK